MYAMKFFSPSAQIRRYRSQQQNERPVESPTNPSDRPLMYVSSGSSSFESVETSSSSSEEEEAVPMLQQQQQQQQQDIEATTTPRTTTTTATFPARSGRNKKRRTTSSRCLKLYLPCIAFLILAWASCFQIRRQSVGDQDPTTILSIETEIELETKQVHQKVIGVPSPEPTGSSRESSPPTSSPPTANPTLRPTEQVLTISPSQRPTDKATFPNHIVRPQTKPKGNLVLHIGPQKTGSTTLQDAWTEPYGMLSESLKQDHYWYRFIHPSSGFFDCDVNQYGGYVNCEASPKLKGLIRTAKNSGQNLLLSDENLDDRFPETIREIIDDNDWDVTVIVVYRRIHQWLVSWYDQINKTTNKDAKGNILFDKLGHPYRREHTLWPDEGGASIPTFSSWYKDFTMHWDPSELVSKHRSIAFRDAYTPYFENVVVHNMHRDGDLMTNFMCDSVPGATHSCQKLKGQTKRLPRDNQSVDLNYDILAVEARQRGFLHTAFKRKFVASRIEKFVTENGKAIPRVCDAEIIDEIRNWLLESEKDMFQDTWTDEKTDDLALTFNAYLDSGKLCDIDFDKVFADDQWLAFFQSLDNRPHLVLHIGPQKTGSTTLQHVWAAPKELRTVMEEDNFDYYFINPHRGTFNCDLDEEDRWVNCNASKTLKQILADASAQKKHLLLSDENLDERFAGALREAINDKQFKVKVVLVYRRIHQWLPSWYSQTNKSTNRDADGNFLRNDQDQPVVQPHTHWPSEGGVHVPNFSDWYRDFADHLDSSDLASNHPSVQFRKTYEPLFDNIAVYEMDQEGDFVTNFMCQMIPEAHKTCLHLKQGNLELPFLNPSVNVEHDILSVSAHEHGLVGTGLSRPEVVERVRTRLQNTPSIELPRLCDDSIRDEIRDWLLGSEAAMFPNKWSPGTSDVALEQLYQDEYAKGKLCDIDIEAVLGDESWIEFFASLGTDRR